jgi:hypothetical protein
MISTIEWTTAITSPNNTQMIVIKLSPERFLFCSLIAEREINYDMVEYEYDLILSREGVTREEVDVRVLKVSNKEGFSIYTDPTQFYHWETIASGIVEQWLNAQVKGILPAESILK